MIHLHSIRHADHFRADCRVKRRKQDETTERLRDEVLVLRWPVKRIKPSE